MQNLVELTVQTTPRITPKAATHNGYTPTDASQPFALTEWQKRKLIKLFNLYDASQSGFLKLSDFERIGRNLATLKGYKSGSFIYEQLLIQFMYHWIRIRGEIKRKIDRKFDATVTLAEWLLYHERVLADPFYHRHIDFLTKQIFDVVEVDESGCFDCQEWQKLLQIYGIPVVQAEEAFATIAQNHDGLLSRTTVISLLEEFYYSQEPDASGNYLFGAI